MAVQNNLQHSQPVDLHQRFGYLIHFTVALFHLSYYYGYYAGDRGLLSGTSTEVKQRRPRLVLGWGDRQGRPSAVNLCPFVGVALHMSPTVYIYIYIYNESNKTIVSILLSYKLI